jgi:hypothetical protein
MKTFKEVLEEKSSKSDELDPNKLYQGTHTVLLVKLASGKINSQRFAQLELMNRGLDKKGKWVGFKEAEDIWKLK